MALKNWLQKMLLPRRGSKPNPTSNLVEHTQLPTVFIIKDIPKTREDMERTSFIGGRPLVPKNFVWPTREPTDDERQRGRKKSIPIHFVCQFDCSAIPQVDGSPNLPPSGIIAVFYALDLEGIVEEGEPPFWRVIHYAVDGQPLVRATPPKGLGVIEIGAELQTDADGRCRRYRELAYMPISYKLGKTSPDRQDNNASSTGETNYRRNRRLAKMQYLGPDPPTPELDITQFSISVRNAKHWLKEELWIVPKRIEVMTDQLADFDAGRRKDHPGKGFFEELKQEKRRGGQTNLEDEEIWQEVADKWRSLLPRFKKRLPKVLELRDELNKLADDELVPPQIKQLFQEQMEFSNEVAIVKNSLDSDDARKSRQFLLAKNCLEDLKLDDIEIALAEHERKVIENNENHLLGYADEVQAASKRQAFDYALSMGWIEPNQSESVLRLFLQLDSCWAGTGMFWGDAGKAYFYITENDLTNRRFDRIAHVFHSH